MTVATQNQTSESSQTLPSELACLTPKTVSIAEDLTEFWKNRSVLFLLARRDISSRYRGSLLGRLWPILYPLGQLLIYTFVFSVVLKIRFGDNPSTGSFAVYFMAGIIPWAIFAESVSRAATVILENPNLVTKVVFPTEILPLVNILSAMSTQGLALAILFVSSVIFSGAVYPTILFLPLIALPLLLFSAGASWILASIGVFVRDTRHLVNLALQAGMYATPILYPASSVPKEYRWVLEINPLAGIIGDFRNILLENKHPDWNSYLAYTAISAVIASVGLVFFLKTKRAFADVM